MQHFLKTECKIGDDITMELTAKRPKRTDAQNNYYHLYLSLIALSSGHTIKQLKTWVKGKFLTEGITEVFGDKVRIVESSSDLNIGEFLELLERIEQVTTIPLPVTDPFTKPLTHNEYNNLKESQKRIYSKLTAKIQ